jgi:hypothetical protein
MINHESIDVNQHLTEIKNVLSPDKWNLNLSNDVIYVKPFPEYIYFLFTDINNIYFLSSYDGSVKDDFYDKSTNYTNI